MSFLLRVSNLSYLLLLPTNDESLKNSLYKTLFIWYITLYLHRTREYPSKCDLYHESHYHLTFCCCKTDLLLKLRNMSLTFRLEIYTTHTYLVYRQSMRKWVCRGFLSGVCGTSFFLDQRDDRTIKVLESYFRVYKITSPFQSLQSASMIQKLTTADHFV